MNLPESFYLPLTDGSLQATACTRGPWSADHQHAGPPCALLARALEQALPSDAAMHILRISFEILRPVPIGPMHITVEPVHKGRTLRVMDGLLTGENGKPLVRARAVAAAQGSLSLPRGADTDTDLPGPANSPAMEFEFFSQSMGYHRAMELRCARGAVGSGAAAVWMRMRVPLVAGETPSPLQRVATAADSGNGVSYYLDPAEYSFMNPDLSIYLHRPPQGEWVCLNARSVAQNSGMGLADTQLLDEAGIIGRSAQSLIIMSRS